MMANAAYREALVHRYAGLERTLLLQTQGVNDSAWGQGGVGRETASGIAAAQRPRRAAAASECEPTVRFSALLGILCHSTSALACAALIIFCTNAVPWHVSG